jgi:hypothetical protein
MGIIDKTRTAYKKHVIRKADLSVDGSIISKNISDKNSQYMVLWMALCKADNLLPTM